MAEQPQRYALITELNEEWARLVGALRDRCPWERTELRGCRDLGEVIAAVRHRPDPVLSALLDETTAHGDLLAGRTVLQAMLGKIVRLARAHPDLGADEFVGAMWCRIRTYPLARRPTRIAANLALDTRKDVLRVARAVRRERSVGSFADADSERLLLHPAASLGSETAELSAGRLIDAAESSGVVDPVTAAVLRTVYLDGVRGRAAAARHGTSAGMIRYRCSRGLRALAAHVAADDAAA